MILFEDFFNTSSYYLFYDRLNPYYQYLDPLTSGWQYRRAVVQQGFVLASLCYMIFGQTLQIYIGYSETKDLVLVTESLSWVIVGFISLDVCLTIRSKSTAMTNILLDLKALYSEDKKCQEQIGSNALHDELVMIFKIFQRAHSTTLAFKLAIPLGKAVIGYIDNGTWQFDLPFHVWYPVNPKNLFFTPFLYLFECWASFLSTGPMVAICIFVAGIGSLICVQFMELTYQFKHFNPRRGDFSQDCAKLTVLVKRHLFLIKLSGILREIFTNFLLRNYVFCSVGISIFMFVSVSSSDTMIILEYCADVACFTCYISILSLFGHRLIEHVRKMSGAVCGEK